MKSFLKRNTFFSIKQIFKGATYLDFLKEIYGRGIPDFAHQLTKYQLTI